MGKDIVMTDWKKSLEDKITEGSTNLVAAYTAKSGLAAALKSDDAKKNFKDRVVSDAAIKKRNRKLDALTDEILHTGMEKTGGTAYSSKLGAALDKAATGFSPYATAINEARKKLPKKTADGKANLLNRAGAIIDAEIAKKKELG